MTDPWAKLAEQQISNPVKSRMKAAATRAQRKQEKELEDRGVLFRMWQKWHAERKAELRENPAARELIEFVESMTINDAERLIELVKASPLRYADANTRFLVLDLIGRGITYLREAEGLDPFDDALPFSDEPPTVFEYCRKLLG